MSLSDSYQRNTLVAAFIALASNFAAAALYHRLPKDPLNVSWHLTVYSYFAIGLSLLGAVGARKRNATCLAIFSNFLLIDMLVCAVPRLAVIIFFPHIRNTICSKKSIHNWLAKHPDSHRDSTSEVVRLEMRHQCRTVIGVLEALFGTLAVGITIVQILLALRVTVWARRLLREEEALRKRSVAHRSSTIAAAEERKATSKGRQST